MRRKLVWFGMAASFIWSACGDVPDSHSTDGGPDASSNLDAPGSDGDGSTSLPSDVTYPDCWSASLKKRLFPCAATSQCVADCAECAPTPINCVGAAACPTSTDYGDRKCVADCSQCTFVTDDGSVIMSEGTDVCSNTCTTLSSDLCNCGACGHSVTGGGTPGTRCDQGHLCPPLPDQSTTVFVPDCAGDAGDAGLCCLTAFSCPDFRDTQCVAPL